MSASKSSAKDPRYDIQRLWLARLLCWYFSCCVVSFCYLTCIKQWHSIVTMQPIAHRRIWLLLWSSTHPSNLTLDHLYCCVTRWNNSFILNIYRRLGKSATIYIGGECSIRLKTFVYWKIENCDWNHCCTQLFLSNHRCLNIQQWIQECIDVKNVWPLLCTLLPGGLWIKSMTCSNYSYVPSLGLVPTVFNEGGLPDIYINLS